MRLFKKLALVLSLLTCFCATACGNLTSFLGNISGNPYDPTDPGTTTPDTTDPGTTDPGTTDPGTTTPSEPVTPTVSGEGDCSVYFYVDDTLVHIENVDEGENATYRTQTDDGVYEFVGWCTDEECENFYDFGREVTADLSLYAYYRLDYAELTNQITTSVIHGAVTVLSWEQTSAFSSKTATSLGSGVIYALENNVYYLLTNNHVVHNLATKVESGSLYNYGYQIEDYIGNTYSGTLLARDPEYDLAVISFAKDDEELRTFDFAESNPTAGEEVVAIGAPGGQKNAITYGEVTKYEEGNLDSASSSIDFDCLYHSAYIAPGSSGGLLMDTSFSLVGINFGYGHNGEGEWTYSMSVPILKVKEFLTAHDLL